MSQLSKPEIDFIAGPAPTELVSTDLVLGTGAEATAGAAVEVHYVGVDFETGEQFDASWDRGESINFPLSGLIAGWQEGIPGMRSAAAGNWSSLQHWRTESLAVIDSPDAH